MGNWRTVSLRGTLAPEHLAAATEFITPRTDYGDWHCLSASDGLCGLGHWIAERISCDGNLAERDYSVQDVADTLGALVDVAPSLELKVHCGGDYESETTVATITVHEGVVSIGEPEVLTVGIDSDRTLGRLVRVLMGPDGSEVAP
jgi:hypothetical protein